MSQNQQSDSIWPSPGNRKRSAQDYLERYQNALMAELRKEYKEKEANWKLSLDKWKNENKALKQRKQSLKAEKEKVDEQNSKMKKEITRLLARIQKQQSE